VIAALRTLNSITHRLRSRLAATEGSQIVEFAVSLPLLMLLAVGIYDFGNAYNLKQKLTNAAREGARMGASQPTNDLSNAPPPSVLAVRDVVDHYLQTARINDCGLGSATATAVGAASPWAWTFTSACTGIGNLVLTVNRGNVFTSAVITVGQPVKVISTQVTLGYPYRWQFNRVASLLGATGFAGTSQLTVVSTMENQN
jgi:Flp pilus assembly protein TadG